MSRKKYSYSYVNAKQHRVHKKRVRFCFILIFTVLLLLFVGNKIVSTKFNFLSFSSINTEDNRSDKENAYINSNIDVSNLYSPYAILVDLNTGHAIAKHNENAKIYPASLTKIMTAILAIENTENLNEEMTMPTDCFKELYAQNASLAGFSPAEKVCKKDLLYGILLPSGAECCIAFADKISGSENAFVDLMNQNAKELGMNNTHFCNSTGLQDSNHYTTVKDISILLKYAIQNKDFRNVFTSHSYSTTPTEQHPDGFTFYSTMFKYMDSPQVTNGEIIGGKTGYTEEAGLCLASMAEINQKEYILVTAKANGTHDTEQFHILDAVNVYNQIGNLQN